MIFAILLLRGEGTKEAGNLGQRKLQASCVFTESKCVDAMQAIPKGKEEFKCTSWWDDLVKSFQRRPEVRIRAR